MNGPGACPFEEEVLLLGDNRLDLARRLVIEAHLAVCESCAETAEALEWAGETLRAAEPEPLGVVGPALDSLPARRPAAVVRVAAAGAVAAACALLFVLLARPERGRPAPVPPVASESGPGPLPPPAPPRGPTTRELIAALDPGHPGFAEDAVRVAARIHRRGARATSALAELLHERDPAVLARAVAVAERCPSPALSEPLCALLSDQALAASAARALGRLGSARAVPALAAALDGPAAVEAREALVAIGGPAAARALEARLCGGRDLSAWLDALVRADPSRGALACARLWRDEGVRAVVVRHAERLIPELRRLVRGRRTQAGGAARALGWARDEEFVPGLAALSKRPAFANDAAAALLTLGGDRAVEVAFRAVLRTPAAAQAFVGARGAEPWLLAVVRTGSRAERAAALELLGRCGGEATVAAIGRDGFERSLRRRCIATLGAIGGPRALEVLARYRDERSLGPDLCAALARIHDPGSASLLVDLLLRGPASRDAGRALADLPAGLVVPLLLERLERPGGSPFVREVLANIAGTDLGRRPENWKLWWDASRP